MSVMWNYVLGSKACDNGFKFKSNMKRLITGEARNNNFKTG